jgi:hypothetical protein
MVDGRYPKLFAAVLGREASAGAARANGEIGTFGVAPESQVPDMDLGGTTAIPGTTELELGSQ